MVHEDYGTPGGVVIMIRHRARREQLACSPESCGFRRIHRPSSLQPLLVTKIRGQQLRM
jgi:hypothetical protein